MISQLEEAASSAGTALRDSQFGAALRAWDPGRRCASVGDTVSDECTELANAEVMLGQGPAIRRTLAAIEHAEVVDGKDIASSDPDYVQWVRAAHWALQRIAGRCWRPVNEPLRTAVLDVDDFNPLVSYYIPLSRKNRLGPALAFEDLQSSAVGSALDDLADGVRAAQVHEAARELVPLLRREPAVMETLLTARDEVLARIRKAAPTIGELRRRAEELLDEAYAELDPDVARIAGTIRALNALINHVLCLLLSHSELTTEVPVVRGDLGSVRVGLQGRIRLAQFTFSGQEAWPFIRNHSPFGFEVRAGGPLDGVYLTVSKQFQFSGSEIVDVSARRLADFERPPRDE